MIRHNKIMIEINPKHPKLLHLFNMDAVINLYSHIVIKEKEDKDPLTGEMVTVKQYKFLVRAGKNKDRIRPETNLKDVEDYIFWMRWFDDFNSP